MGPSRLRVGGPEKDAGLISLEYPRGWTDPSSLPPHPPTFSIFMEHDITLSRPRAQPESFDDRLDRFPLIFMRAIR